MTRARFLLGAAAALGLFTTMAAKATWSIIIVDTRTKEIAVGSATCLTNFDLARNLPVLRVDVGAGCAQSQVDTNGLNRTRIWNGLIAGTSPADILSQLAANDGAHQRRQYGIVDTRGRALTFTGAQCGAYANGLTGHAGDLVFAIQGNVITGQPVLDMARDAILSTPGALPEKLIAAMEAARAMGGDGRCSCTTGAPPDCGSPPPSFERSAYIAFMITSRRGDTDGTCGASGCANGSYYMFFNVFASNGGVTDPVIRLRNRFNNWRTDLVGVPDAVESVATFDSPRILNNGLDSTTLQIELRDWQQMPALGTNTVSIVHDPAGSAGSSAIGPVTDLGNGLFEANVTAGAVAGVDRFAITVNTGADTVWLIPSPTLFVQDARGDLNEDGAVDVGDLDVLLRNFGGGTAGDVDGDSDTDLTDLSTLLLFIGRGF